MPFKTPIVLPDEALVYDIETDSLYQRGGPTMVHCLVVQHYRSGEVFSFADHPGYPSLRDGVEILAEAPVTIGHNAISFDLRLLNKLCGGTLDRSKCLDTAILSRALLPDIDSVFAKLPPDVKSHSLEAWGLRLGYRKGAFAKRTDWRHFDREMLAYCKRDVLLTRKVVDFLAAYEAEIVAARRTP